MQHEFPIEFEELPQPDQHRLHQRAHDAAGRGGLEEDLAGVGRVLRPEGAYLYDVRSGWGERGVPKKQTKGTRTIGLVSLAASKRHASSKRYAAK